MPTSPMASCLLDLSHLATVLQMAAISGGLLLHTDTASSPADEGLTMAAKRLKRIPPMNPNAPVLSKEDYFTIPPIKRMRRFSDEELQV